MRRPGWFCLAFVLLATVSAIAEPERDGQVAVAEPGTTVTDEHGADHARPDETEPAAIEPLNIVQEATEPAEAEPLAPIETQHSIRVNANVNLPQDI